MTTEARTGVVAFGIVLGGVGLVGGTLALVSHRHQELQPVHAHPEKVKLVGVYSGHDSHQPPQSIPTRVQPLPESAKVDPLARPAVAAPAPAPGHKVGYGPSESANGLLDFLKEAAKNAPPGGPAKGADPVGVAPPGANIYPKAPYVR